MRKRTFRPENPREEQRDPEFQPSWWDLFVERFFMWWYHGGPFPIVLGLRKKSKKVQTYPVMEVYGRFVKGDLTDIDVYEMLKPRQVPEFIQLHEQVRAALSGNGTMPSQLSKVLATVDNRRLVFILNQIDGIVTDLEREVTARSTDANVVRREA